MMDLYASILWWIPYSCMHFRTSYLNVCQAWSYGLSLVAIDYTKLNEMRVLSTINLGSCRGQVRTLVSSHSWRCIQQYNVRLILHKRYKHSSQINKYRFFFVLSFPRHVTYLTCIEYSLNDQLLLFTSYHQWIEDLYLHSLSNNTFRIYTKVSSFKPMFRRLNYH